MTALRIWKTSSPSMVGAPVIPMSKQDAEFWRLRKLRIAAPKVSAPAQPSPASKGMPGDRGGPL